MENIIENVTDQQKIKTLRVLIADDDPPTRILLRTAISQWGYSVTEASDGEEAWKVLQESPGVHLVILDWIMPKLDGLDLCRLINHELTYRPYIILLTQVSGSENIVKGLEAGANEFLSKPFNMAELRSRLSVGARIINFKLELDQRYKQLQGYITNLESVSNLVEDISMKIDELSKLMQSNNDHETNALSTARIAELKKNMKQLTAVIQEFKLQSKFRSDTHE